LSPRPGLPAYVVVILSFDTARKEFKSALAADPNIAASHDGLGQIYEHDGSLDAALAEYKRASDLDPSLEGVRQRLRRVRDRIR